MVIPPQDQIRNNRTGTPDLSCDRTCEVCGHVRYNTNGSSNCAAFQESLTCKPESENQQRWNKCQYLLPHVSSCYFGKFFASRHPIRRTLAAATVKGYLLCEHHRFAQEAREYPSFGADLLEEVGLALKGFRFNQYQATYQDPLSCQEAVVTRFRAG